MPTQIPTQIAGLFGLEPIDLDRIGKLCDVAAHAELIQVREDTHAGAVPSLRVVLEFRKLPVNECHCVVRTHRDGSTLFGDAHREGCPNG